MKERVFICDRVKEREREGGVRRKKERERDWEMAVAVFVGHI